MMKVDSDRRILMIVLAVFLMFQHIQFVTSQGLVALMNHHHQDLNLNIKFFI